MASAGFDTFMVYTTTDSPFMNVIWCSREEYEHAKRKGRLGIEPYEETELRGIALAPVEDLRDFVLDPVKP